MIGTRFAARIDSKAGTGSLCNLSEVSRGSRDGDEESLRIDTVLSQDEEQRRRDAMPQAQEEQRPQSQDDRGRSIQDNEDEDERWGTSGEYNRKYGESLPIRLGSFGGIQPEIRRVTRPIRPIQFVRVEREYTTRTTKASPCRDVDPPPQHQADPSPQDSQGLNKPELFSFYSSS